MATFPGWEKQVLRGIGARVTPQNLRFLRDWAAHEGQSLTHYNPLNTTQQMPGAGLLPGNSSGVKIYRSPQQGLRATVKTLTNGYYPTIVKALRAGDPYAYGPKLVPEMHTWGTTSFAATLGSGSSAPSIKLKAPRASDVEMVKSMLGQQQPAKLDLQTATATGLQHLIQGDYDPVKALQALQPVQTTQETPQAPQRASAAPVQPQVVHGAKPTSKRDQQAVALVKEYLGTPYVWGGSQPGGFDCSGLLQYVWAKVGVNIPRVTYDQWNAGRAVPRGALRPADAVFFEPSSRGPGHVGMYIGGGKFIESPHTGANVRISTLAGRRDYMGARRFA